MDTLSVVQQDTVSFYGHDILAVRLSDGRVAAVFTDLCAAIGLDRASQARRIRNDDTLAAQYLSVPASIDGGERLTDVLTAWAIPTWLTGIQASRVAPEKRDAIRAFKREAADALYRHFSQPQQVVLQPPVSLVPAEPIEQPVAPPQDAPADLWIQYHQQMITFLEWQQDIETWRGDLESRMESVEEIARLVPEILERLGPATLSPEHQRAIQAFVNRLHDVTGATHNSIYGELKDTFHVGTYKEIPDTQWLEVSRWFQARIDKSAR